MGTAIFTAWIGNPAGPGLNSDLIAIEGTSMNLFTDATFATSVSTLATAVIDSAKGRGKIAAAFRDIAAPAYGEPAKQSEVAELLGAVRREIQTKRESYCKWLSSNGQAANVDAFRKSVINAVTYVGKVAGDAAGCAFKYD